jgi:hypothetical protein
MMAKILPRAYDIAGKRVSHLNVKYKRHGFKPTFPMGTYLNHPLSIDCGSIPEVAAFLLQCKYVSDQEQFNKPDYWMPPQEFEQRKKGDCDDFALWTWRQLMAMGCQCRFVVGRAGRYGDGHASVTLEEKDINFLVEPLMVWLGQTFPSLSTVRYEPRVSVEWDGKQIRYYSHEKRSYNPSVRELLPLFWEWICFWPGRWPKMAYWRSKRWGRLAMNYWKSRH